MHLKSALLAVALLPVFAVGQTSQSAAAPTVSEAQAFMDKAEADLLALSNEAGRAAWVQATFITDDTEAIAAKADERLLTRTNELVIGARRFKGMMLPPDLDRKFMLLRLNGSPTDPKLVAELTQVAASLDGMYGKGKYCANGDKSKCLGIEELDVLMAKSRDPKDLLGYWQGWDTISPPMRDKYARPVTAPNQ